MQRLFNTAKLQNSCTSASSLNDTEAKAMCGTVTNKPSHWPLGHDSSKLNDPTLSLPFSAVTNHRAQTFSLPNAHLSTRGTN